MFEVMLFEIRLSLGFEAADFAFELLLDGVVLEELMLLQGRHAFRHEVAPIAGHRLRRRVSHPVIFQRAVEFERENN